MPVIAPRSVAVTGPRPAATDLVAPVPQNTESPTTSNRCTPRSIRSSAGCAKKDALPIEELTGLPYASTVTATDRDGNQVPVMHACGHDMHVTWLAGASALLAGA